MPTDLPYFSLANEQTNHIGDLWQEPNWLLCSIERLQSVVRAIGELLERNASSLAYRHDHRQRWSRGASYRRSVKWSGLERYYMLDRSLHALVNASGCIAHSRDGELRRRLERVIAPTAWL